MIKGRARSIALILGCILLSSVAYAATAKDAWNILVNPYNRKKPAFAFVQNNPALPNVLIYGDSISIGYTQRVRERLKGKANVYRLYCNGVGSSSFIPKMTKMHETMRDKKLEGHWDFDWDVIHFNVGLHDLRRRSKWWFWKPISSTEVYAKNIRNILVFMKKLAPKAKPIFATTTPVPEGANLRRAGDAEKYNAVALMIMKDFPEVTVNDLFNFIKPNHSQWWIKPHDVHYSNKGYQALGDEVARAILYTLEERPQ